MTIKVTILSAQPLIPPKRLYAQKVQACFDIQVYILLFTQTPIPGCLDGTIIDSRIIPVTLYYCGYVGV